MNTHNKFSARVGLITVLLLGAFIVSASADWSGPSLSPPNGNVPAPINVGDNSQSKLGQLFLNTDTGSPYTVGLTVFGKSILKGVQIEDGTQGTGKVLTSDSNGNATWQTPSNNIITQDFNMDASFGSLTIGSSGTNAEAKTVTVNNAAVGDTVIVGLPANYYVGAGGYDSGGLKTCGAVTATVSAANTVKINFWNSYGSTSCSIPIGTYKIKILK